MNTNKLPNSQCTRPSLPCGKRHPNNSCRTKGCAYYISTAQLTPPLRALLAQKG